MSSRARDNTTTRGDNAQSTGLIRSGKAMSSEARASRRVHGGGAPTCLDNGERDSAPNGCTAGGSATTWKDHARGRGAIKSDRATGSEASTGRRTKGGGAFTTSSITDNRAPQAAEHEATQQPRATVHGAGAQPRKATRYIAYRL